MQQRQCFLTSAKKGGVIRVNILDIILSLASVSWHKNIPLSKLSRKFSIDPNDQLQPYTEPLELWARGALGLILALIEKKLLD